MTHSPNALPYWGLSSFYFFYFALLGAWIPYWALYLQALDYTAEQIGYLLGIAMFTKFFAPSLWSWVADRRRQRMPVIRLGALLAWLCFLGVHVHSANFWWLALVIVCFSFFWNAILAQFEVVTLKYLGVRYQNYGRIRLWGSVGFIVTVVALGALFDVIAIEWLPVIFSLQLVALWISSLLVKGNTLTETFEPREAPLASILKQPAVLAFLACVFLLQVSHGPYYTFFSIHLENYGYSRSLTGMLWSLGVMAEVGIFLITYRLLSRFSLKQVLLASLVLTMIRWLLIGYYADNLTVIVFAQCLHAASFGTCHAVAVEVIRRLFSGGHEGQGMAIYSGISFGAGGAVGAVISGWVWEVNPQWVFVFAALAGLLAFLVVVPVRLVQR